MLAAGVATALLALGGVAEAQQSDWICRQFIKQGLDCNGYPLNQPQQYEPAPVSPQRWTRVGPNTYRNLDVSRPEGGRIAAGDHCASAADEEATLMPIYADKKNGKTTGRWRVVQRVS